MSQQMRATMITLVVMITLLLWVPFLYLAQSCLQAISSRLRRTERRESPDTPRKRNTYSV